MMERWQLHRAGMFNFWLYDEQVFPLQGGRVLFRGANGAGKSVTMQSFLPLVLDGDTRPWRLDPFGSKDRKVEYYLLGDETLAKEHQHADRTGYLWMEFYHLEQDRYLTVGIGLRARRGNHQNDFWGFALTDGRRIGVNFDLYRKTMLENREAKIPLDWKALRDEVGVGGQVVRERKEYRRLVNKLLFKFESDKQFQELLDLLIQLRSPKLSKDFKPTTIYEILNNGLPPLLEEELRPLAEVLEAIDQIGDRKKELETHVEYVGRLANAYERYNEQQLVRRSDQVVQSAQALAEQEQTRKKKEEDLAAAQSLLQETEEDIRTVQNNLRTARKEIDLLEADEAFEKEFELKANQEKAAHLLDQIEKNKSRLDAWKQRATESERRVSQYKTEQVGLEKVHQHVLDELEQTAGEVEFTYHHVYHRRFQQESWQEGDQDMLWNSWKKAIHEHEHALKQALECAREHSRSKEALQERTAALSQATERRDLMEKAATEAEERLETVKEEQQVSFFHWRSKAQLLRLKDEEMSALLHLLERFPEAKYEELKKIVDDRFALLLDRIRQEKAQQESEARRLREERGSIHAELQEWKQQKEPEPKRSKARERTRQKYALQNISGTPLYAACEFHPHVPDPLRGTLESLLQETGLLDAWIGDGGAVWERDDEEFWLESDPLDFGYTLADFLKPTPPEDGSLTAEQIDRILRSIEVGEGDQASERVILSKHGRFRMGTLSGRVPPKARAEFIGKESRKQTRLVMIAQLEEDLLALDEHLQQLEQKIGDLKRQEEALRADAANFPSGDNLLQARDEIQSARLKLQTAQEDLTRHNGLYKEVLEIERELRERLLELTRAWSSLKTELRLRDAVEQMRTYLSDFFTLQNKWTQYVNLKERLTRERNEWEQAREQADLEEEQLTDAQEQFAEVTAVIEAFRKVLEEMGVAEKHETLTRLRQEATHLETSLGTHNSAKQKHEVKKKVCQEHLNTLRENCREAETKLQENLHVWRREWSLLLLPAWRDKEMGEERSEQVTLCRHILKQINSYEAKKFESANSNLIKVFYEVQPHLHEYALELAETSEGRHFVQFNYDRNNPVTPEWLLENLNTKWVEQNLLLQDKEKELIEKVLIQSVGVSIRMKIQRAEQWVKQMNALMRQRHTSSGLQLKLHWEPKPRSYELEMDTRELVELLSIDYEHLDQAKRERINEHFQARINKAKEMAENQGALRKVIHEFLDYREWYHFKLSYKKGDTQFRELTDGRFNVMSGGEKAMAMYIPLFCAVTSRYNGSAADSPKLISLDEAFAGVDDDNVRDMFELLTQMELDFMMTSQVLWGCYDTVPGLAIYEIVRPQGAEDVDVIPYTWNGKVKSTNFDLLDEVQVG